MILATAITTQEFDRQPHPPHRFRYNLEGEQSDIPFQSQDTQIADLSSRLVEGVNTSSTFFRGAVEGMLKTCHRQNVLSRSEENSDEGLALKCNAEDGETPRWLISKSQKKGECQPSYITVACRWACQKNGLPLILDAPLTSLWFPGS